MTSTIQHGVNITANDVKDLVESGTDAAGRKTWQDLYGSSALSYQAQNDALLKSYGDIIAEAYKSSLQQQNALYDFGLSANDTHDLRNIARQDMLAAYDTYLGQYQQAQQEIAEAYQTQKSTWDQALTDESTNFANLYNYATKYYTDVLRGATYTGDDLDKPKFVEQGKEAVQDGYEQKTESLIDRYGLQWLTATNEDGSVRQLTNEELMNKLFDAKGNMTELGREFYDMVFNIDLSDERYTDAEGNAIKSFDAWLSDTDSDLYTWAYSPDTFNYTRRGTKLGTAKTWVGLESDDEKFQAYQTGEGVNARTNQILSNLNTALTDNTTLQDDMTKIKSYADDGLKKGAMYASTKHQLEDTYNELSKAASDYKSTLSTEISALVDTVLNNVSDDIKDKYSTELEKLLDEINNYTLTLSTYEEEVANHGTGNYGFLEYRNALLSSYDSLNTFAQNITKRLNKIIETMYSENAGTVSGR